MTVPTLRGRLALAGLATTAAWVGLLTIGFNVLLSSQLHAQEGLLLRQRAAAAASTVTIAADGSVHVVDPADDEALDTDVWIYAGRTAVERPRAGAQLQGQADALAGLGEQFVSLEEPQAHLLYALPVRAEGRQVATVVAAVSLEPYRNVTRIARLGTAGLALLLLAGAYALTRILVARALAPVQAMSSQAARWSAAGAAERFGDAPRPRELAQLAGNLDGVLDRLAALLRHEQQVTEELSHELRTPLSLLTAEIDLLRARPRDTAEVQQASLRMADASTHMTDILETLLTTARTRTLSNTGRCLLEPVVTTAADRVAGGVHVEVQPDRAGLMAGVDAQIVERILAPLLDNAGRYARSRIDISFASDPPFVVVRVRDDGPGVPLDLGDDVFEPGRRGSDGHAGAGLGLALARRLARVAGGDLLLADGAFEVRLPAA